jgi:hypothetical protein
MELTFILKHFSKKSYDSESILGVLRKLFKETDASMSLNTFYRKWILTTSEMSKKTKKTKKTKKIEKTETDRKALYTVRKTIHTYADEDISVYIFDFGFYDEEAVMFKNTFKLKKRLACKVRVKGRKIFIASEEWKSTWDDFLQTCLIENEMMDEAERNTGVFFKDF